ncbi:hypothetical protein LCGC14_1238110 [marine sediment metagenome]|uniref:Uncharacterized protein n=1 Tax=marine sediment metagenome TaxID=412755 RepID=A0A0F9NNT8_9ZZZZ|nr:hypothetical protein [archaeon]
MEHKKWVLICIIGGALMITSSLVGSVGFYGRFLELASVYVGPKTQAVLGIILMVFSYIAAAGGISVIIGALIAGFSSNFAGRLVVGMGLGTGIFSIITLLITSIYGGSSINDLPTILISTFNGVYGLTGVIISIFARMKLKD